MQWPQTETSTGQKVRQEYISRPGTKCNITSVRAELVDLHRSLKSMIQSGMQIKKRDESKQAVGVGDEAAAAESSEGLQPVEDERVSRCPLLTSSGWTEPHLNRKSSSTAKGQETWT